MKQDNDEPQPTFESTSIQLDSLADGLEAYIKGDDGFDLRLSGGEVLPVTFIDKRIEGDTP